MRIQAFLTAVVNLQRLAKALTAILTILLASLTVNLDYLTDHTELDALAPPCPIA